MNPARPFAAYREELAPGLYRRRGIYAPFVWLAVWMVRAGLRCGLFSRAAAAPLPAPKPKPTYHFTSRHLRRARASCFARARRHVLKGRKIKPDDYIPRAYAHLAYVKMMDKTATAGQFKERYIRDNGISRAEVYGLGGNAEGVEAAPPNLFAQIFGHMPLNLGAPANPAPP